MGHRLLHFCARWGARISLGAGLMVSAAQAADLPRYDPEAYCQKIANFSGGSDMLFNGCIEMEQEAYDKLKPLWASIPEKTRAYCNKIARTSGGSYSLLDGCIDMELEAAGEKKGFRF